MSVFDDISGDDALLPAFGVGGVIVFLILLLWAYHSHSSAMKYGFTATIMEIGTCKDADCVIRVKRTEGMIEQRETGSKVFVGDVVKCNESRCYKD